MNTNTDSNTNTPLFVLGRRGFLITAVAGVGATLSALPLAGSAAAAQAVPQSQKGRGCPPILTAKRILGSGNDKLEVSALSFGCMGIHSGRGPAPDRPAMLKLIRQAVERGITFLDTAEGYGPFVNEELLGEAVAPFRKELVISTKFSGDFRSGKMVRDNRPERIRSACEASLKRLKTDVIDIYYMHRVDKKTPVEDVAGAVGELIRQGKVRHFGLSEVGAGTIRKAHAVTPVTAIQSEYSLMFRKPETEVFSTLEELGIGFVAYSPLGRGFLGGGLTEYTKFDPQKDIRGVWPRFTPEALRANTRLLEVLNEFGKTRGMTSAQIAMSWMLTKYPFVVPLFGTTKLSHLEEDARTADFTLSMAERKEIEDKIEAIGIVGDRYDAANQSSVEY
jgi:aryl-alcohol dehydrogenase-like predicted oxidoreductase